MNIKNIQKQYDKLTYNERFALLVAATDRGDAADRAALVSSAPRKTWQVPTTWGLGQAFNFLADFHTMMQMGYAASFWYMLFHEDDETTARIIGLDFNDAMILLQRRIITSREAFRVVCSDYGVDPEKLLEGLPFIEMIQIVELFIGAANYESPLEFLELQENIDGLKAAIETKRKDWE